jgi:hypothetical protein
MPITKCIIKEPTIREADLSSQNALGFAYQEDFEIEIEKNQSSKEYLNTLIHEMLHCFLPDLKEGQITRLADIMSNQIWRKNYRRVKK